MTPRIQGGRPAPSDFVFTVTLGFQMSPSEICAVGDVLGPYVWFTDGTDPDTLLCWVDEGTIDVTFPGGFSAWWSSLLAALGDLGASASA